MGEDKNIISEKEVLPGNGAVIDSERIEKALEILQKYKAGKASLENRIIQNEEWWKMRYSDNGKVRRGSAWLFNSIANKHADAMDNYPEPCVLPREKSDTSAAKELSSVIPVILEQNDFQKKYSRIWYDKLKYGTGCYGVFWNPELSGGLGDVEISVINLLNLFWENGIEDLQKSKNVFHVELWDNDILADRYSLNEDELTNPVFECSRFFCDDTADTSGKTAVIDWYYKKREGERTVLHYCKFCAGRVLFASENDERFKNGFYAHGKYPFFLDSLYPVQGTPCGFGFIDVMKETQAQIDCLGEAVTENARMGSKVRYFIRSDGSINEEEFADWASPFVHVQGSKLGEDSLRQIKVSPIDPIYISILNNKIEELKETSGNRDFSQGGTTGGITAASAIAALQEAGSKLSRDMINDSYDVYSSLVSLIVELIREFYDTPRFFRIIGSNEELEFISYENSAIKEKNQGDAFGISLGVRLPVFDIRVKAQKQSPFARVSQNELAKEFFNMGFFEPERASQALLCMSMMEFEGKDRLMDEIRRNASFRASGGAGTDLSGTGASSLAGSPLYSAVRSAARMKDGGR